MKKQSSVVEPVVIDTAACAAAEKEKADEKGKGGKVDAKKVKDKGDKKVCIQLCNLSFIGSVLSFSRVVLIYRKPPAVKK